MRCKAKIIKIAPLTGEIAELKGDRKSLVSTITLLILHVLLQNYSICLGWKNRQERRPNKRTGKYDGEDTMDPPIKCTNQLCILYNLSSIYSMFAQLRIPIDSQAPLYNYVTLHNKTNHIALWDMSQKIPLWWSLLISTFFAWIDRSRNHSSTQKFAS